MAKFYTDETLKFFRGIKRNQKKEWYEKNKALYQRVFQEASGLLIEALKKNPEFGALDLKGSQKSSLFRIHRDVRFSHNKLPYKTHGAFVMTRSGGKKDPGVFYMHVEPSASGMWLGYWQLDPKILANFRNWIVEHPDRYLANVEERLKSRGLEFSSDDDLKRLPRGFQEIKDTRLHAALKRRSFGVWVPLTDAELTGPKLESKVRDFVKRASPLLLWGESLISDV